MHKKKKKGDQKKQRKRSRSRSSRRDRLVDIGSVAREVAARVDVAAAITAGTD